MPEYREPEENLAQTAHEERVNAVLDEAVRNCAMLQAAMLLGEPGDVVEHWVDAYWNGLRDNLSDDHPHKGGSYREEDRLTAITLLLADRVAKAADEILNTVRRPAVDHG